LGVLLVEGAIEKLSEPWLPEEVDVAEFTLPEPAGALTAVAAWPECVARANTPATTKLTAAIAATTRFAPADRFRARSIRETVGATRAPAHRSRRRKAGRRSRLSASVSD
jgi:hypothetical protein